MSGPKRLEPLIITDPTGDEAIFQYWPDGVEKVMGATVSIAVRRFPRDTTLGGIPAALFTRDQVRQAIRWLATALGETSLLAAPSDSPPFRVPAGEGFLITDRPLGPCAYCGRDIMPSAFVISIPQPAGKDGVVPTDLWAHDGCKRPPFFDRRPHSRACGLLAHEHGTSCASDCTTCGGRD